MPFTSLSSSPDTDTAGAANVGGSLTAASVTFTVWVATSFVESVAVTTKLSAPLASFFGV